MFGPGGMTPGVKFLLIANIAVFVLQTLLGSVTDYRLTLYFGLVPARVLQDLYLWQLFTYQFLHGGLLHILFNMLAVWMFGKSLSGASIERRIAIVTDYDGPATPSSAAIRASRLPYSRCRTQSFSS